jgi:surface protein
MMRLTFLMGVVAFSSPRAALAGYVFDDSSIRTAVAAWHTNATAAESTYGHISTWETGGVTDMSYLFEYVYFYTFPFNEDIGAWDTSGVTTMRWMFAYASAFNRDISDWAVNSVTDMSGMFYEAYAFNQDIGGWAVHSVTDMNWMFGYASAFNQDLSWCVDDDVGLGWAFSYSGCASTSCGVKQAAGGCPPSPAPTTHAPTYTIAPTASPLIAVDGRGDNGIRTAVDLWRSDSAAAIRKYGHISTWQTGGVKDMSHLFGESNSWYITFNEDISAWDTSGVTDMTQMFIKNSVFNQPIGKWKTGTVRDMSDMFDDATSFNQDLSSWDVGAVTSMYDIFEGAIAFDQVLGWCVQHGCSLQRAFHGTKCKSTFCGVTQMDVFGICEPFSPPCLIGTGSHSQCKINSPTLIIIIVLALLLCCCCCCLYCRKKKERSSTTSSQPASPAESPPELGPEEPDEEETRAAAEETTVEETVEPSSLSKLTSFLFGEREEAPTEETPTEEEEAATLPVFAEAEEEATEQPPPPPARRWFSSAESEPAAPKSEEMHQRMASWYNNAPEAATLRATWGVFPEPGEFQAWSGFVAVTNAFLDREAGEPEA